MATPTIDTTLAGANANSYISLADANTYFDSRLHKSDWTGATTPDKTIALIWATRLLDAWVDWKGYRTKEDQALRWPRYDVYDLDSWLIDSDIVPQFLQDATCELAMHLIGQDSTAQPDTVGFAELKLGDLALKVDPSDRDKYGALPDSVLSIVEPYGVIRTRSGAGTKKLLRS